MEAKISLDLHGKNCYQARVSIDAALRRCDNSVYRLELIHGSIHGTALRDMIRSEYAAHPRVIACDTIDAGRTILILRR